MQQLELFNPPSSRWTNSGSLYPVVWLGPTTWRGKRQLQVCLELIAPKMSIDGKAHWSVKLTRKEHGKPSDIAGYTWTWREWQHPTREDAEAQAERFEAAFLRLELNP